MSKKRKVPRADRRAQLIFVLMLVLVFGGLGAWFYSMKSSEPPRFSPNDIRFPEHNATRIQIVGYAVNNPTLRIPEEAPFFPALFPPQYAGESHNWMIWVTSSSTLKGETVLLFCSQAQVYPYQSQGITVKGHMVSTVGTLYYADSPYDPNEKLPYIICDSLRVS